MSWRSLPESELTEKVYAGFSRGQLHQAFELVENRENWKRSLFGVIEPEQFEIVNAAAQFFTGAGVKIDGRLPSGHVIVRGPGYYQTIGA